MQYDEDGNRNRRIYRPLRGRRPVSQGVPEPGDQERNSIMKVAGDHPRWGPREVYSELRLTGHDIPLEQVEVTLAR